MSVPASEDAEWAASHVRSELPQARAANELERLDRALRLIDRSSYSISQAAASVGLAVEKVRAAVTARNPGTPPPPMNLGRPLPGEPDGPPLTRPAPTTTRVGRRQETARNQQQQPPPFPATPPRPAAAQEPDTIRIPLAATFVDPTYQREPNYRWVTAQVRDYDPGLLGVIDVSDRGEQADPRYAVVDGGNRCALVQAIDPAGAEATILAKVHVGLTVQEEAELFYRFDAGRRRLTGWDRWKARRAQGDPTVLGIEDAVDGAGLRLCASNNRGGKGAIISSAACERLWGLGGQPLVAETGRVLVAAWGDREAFTGGIVEGVGWLLHAYPAGEVARPRVVDACQSMQWRNVEYRARGLREVGIKGSLPRLIVHQLVLLINDRRGPGRQVLEGGVFRLERFEKAARDVTRVVPGR